MDRLTKAITSHRRAVIAVFLALALICAVLMLGVSVNYKLADYLPPDAESTVALGILNDEFGSGIPNTRVMVSGLTLAEAEALKSGIAAVDGVTGVMWLDDVEDLSTPVELMDPATVEQYWRDGSALYQVTVADGRESSTIDALYELIGENGAIGGDAANTANIQKRVVTEVLGAAAIAVPIIVLLLILTTTSWVAPLLFLASIGVAILINMGTNIVFGEISFITQSVSPIMQLAVSLDYAIFLLNSFERHRQETDDVEMAMRAAIKESFSSIAASAATTVFGFMALMFMRFEIGADLGMNLVKGVILSYVSVVVFLPCLSLACVKLLDKTRHKRIIPELHGLGRGLVKIRIPALILVLLLVIPCYLGQSRASFVYGMGVPDPDLRYGQDTELINDTFGQSTSIVLFVPRGDPGAEAALSAELAEIDNVTSVMSYAATVGEVPPETLDDAIVSNFYSDNYARIVLSADTANEGEEAFAVIEAVRAAADKYYDESYTCGESANLYDVREVVTEDTGLVNGIAIVFILLTLLVTFRSLTLPFILLFAIESAIWINLSFAYFTGNTLVYIGYLVINTVQLGATIDYAILITDGYLINRRTMGRREAVVNTLQKNFISVLTSGLILSTAGLGLNFTSSMQVVSELGLLLSRGTLLSMAMVLLALPALLMIFDPLTARLTLKAGFLKKTEKEVDVK